MAYAYLSRENERKTKKCVEKLKYLPQPATSYYNALVETAHSPGTCCIYLDDLEKFLRYANDEAEEVKDLPDEFFSSLTPDDIAGYRDSLIDEGCKANSARRRLSTLASFFDHLKARGVCKTNPVRKIDWPKAESPHNRMTDPETRDNILDGLTAGKHHYWEGKDPNGGKLVKKLKADLKTELIHELLKSRNVAIVRLIAGEGLQLQEIVALDVEDFNEDSRSLNVISPDGVLREVTLLDDTFFALMDYLTPEDATEAYEAYFKEEFDDILGFCLAHKVDTELRKSAIEAYPDRGPDFYENICEMTDEIRLMGRRAIGPKDNCRALFISRLGTRITMRAIQKMLATAKKTYASIDDQGVSPRSLRALYIRSASYEELEDKVDISDKSIKKYKGAAQHPTGRRSGLL